ncbi:hypothetical protein JTE90_002340 [Oedothorax gibbosus]|uniref:Uncharacterized protein n=1 Tax=Oedothorax gibbosus TaxID=931172 RepID=A0AAV6ULG4_9ARAC|nr:hypothetical protein JTE90_002340 [Oedothorax gibbosus]
MSVCFRKDVLRGGLESRMSRRLVPLDMMPPPKEGSLTLEEKRFLVAVERGDLASTRSNGLVGRKHRRLKAAIKCHATDIWTDTLPTVILGIRSCLKDDTQGSVAEMVYGTTLKLPREFFRNSSSVPEMTGADFVYRLRSQMRLLLPAAVTFHASQKTFVHKDLLRRDPEGSLLKERRRSSPEDLLLKALTFSQDLKPLEQPYKGPFKVIFRSDDKFFTLDINGRQDAVSLDGLKPAFILYEDDFPLDTSRATTEPSTSTVPKASTSTVPKASTSTVPKASTSTVPKASTSTVPKASTSTVPKASTSTVPSIHFYDPEGFHFYGPEDFHHRAEDLHYTIWKARTLC